MISVLWRDRVRHPPLSGPWLKAWAKRAWTAPGLARFLWRGLSLRIKGVGVSKRAICSKIHIHGTPSNLHIGDDTCVGTARFGCEAPIKIGRCVVINDEACLLTGSHDIDDRGYGHVFKEIVIEDFAWVATRALVLQGVRIGEGAVVAAGAVVARDVEPYTVVGGNPARVISRRVRQPYHYRPAAAFAPLEAWLGREPGSDV